MNMSITSYKKQLQQLQPLIALFLLCLIIAIFSDRFMTVTNLWNVMRQISVNICIAVGMTLVIISAGIDLSVGSVLAFAGAVTASFLSMGLELPFFGVYLGFTTLGAILMGIAMGGVLGLVNGWVITYFKVQPFVATLAMLTIARGLTMLWTQGYPISSLGAPFAHLGTGWFLGVPIPVWIAAIVTVLAVFVMRKTRFGRYIYAIGGNERAARLSGIKVNQVKTLVYMLAGMLAAVGGILVTSRLDSAQPNAGMGYELDAIAAVVIGGTSLSGGRGLIMGTVLGAVIIGVLNNGLVLLGVSPFWQQVVKGMVILIAVIIDRSQHKEKK